MAIEHPRQDNMNGLAVSRSKRLVGLAIAMAMVVAACASTQLERAWVKPDVGTLNMRRIVAIALSKDPVRRQAMEASIADGIRDNSSEVQVTESSSLINDADIRDEARVRERLELAGFDSQIVMRVTDVDRSDVYVPGSTTSVPEYYRTFWGYYRYWVPIAYEPGYVEHDRNVRVETEVYSSAAGGELVYSAISQTLNPSSAGDLAKHVTSVVAKDMKEKGLLR